MTDPRPIGVFDSGVGGLTVVRSIIDLLPGESLTYFGDSARYPYGPRPLDEIRGFAREIARFLLDRDVKMLVVACNSIEVAAIEDLAASSGVPVLGVIEPGVRAAIRATRNRRVGVIGTEATIRSRAYERAVAGTRENVELFSAACPEFVPHVEAGDTTSDELRDLAERYLAPLRGAGVDALILGCTHYPLLSGLLQVVMGADVQLISSAEETAKDVYAELLRRDVLSDGPASYEFVSSGDPELFRTLGARFLGPEVAEVRSTALATAARHAWS